jgi:hypothetical protein
VKEGQASIIDPRQSHMTLRDETKLGNWKFTKNKFGKDYMYVICDLIFKLGALHLILEENS